MDAIMHPQVLQDQVTAAWNNDSPTSTVSRSPSPIESITLRMDSRSSSNGSITSNARSERDGSPELQITEVRKIKKIVPTKSAQTKESAWAETPPGTATRETVLQPVVQKRESFDINLIDPALRDQASKATSNMDLDQPLLSPKRPGEDLQLPNSKRLQLDDQTTSPTSSVEVEMPDAPIQLEVTGAPPIPLPPQASPHWLPGTWTKQDYINLAINVDRGFNYPAYARWAGRNPAQIAEVFRGLVIAPIMEAVDAQFPTGIKNPASQPEAMMERWRAQTAQLSAILAEDETTKMKLMKTRVLAEVGAEMRVQIEDEIKNQLKTEGWVQLNKAKDLIAGYEREIQETKPESPGEGNKMKNKIKSLGEAQKDLIAATAMFEKARKAEERKTKNAEREAKGEGSKKLGRPKKGEGKGKGADFV